MTDRDRLLADEAAGWAELGACLGSIPPERFEEPTLTPEGWSPKDAVYHVAGWLEECAVVLGQIRDGTFDQTEHEVDGDERAFIERTNDAWFARSRTMDPEAVRAALAPARARALDAFAALDPLTPEAREWFEESGSLHYATHAAELRRWLEARP
jgi:hypothetical protein